MRSLTQTSERPNRTKRLLGAVCLLALTLGGCSDASDLIDLGLNPPGREPIDTSITGVNNFFVNREFGTISQQYEEIRGTLGLKFVRVLFAWTNGVQDSPNAEPNYSFYDQILSNIPPGVDVLVVLSHTPDWINNPANWENGNPRTTFVNQWVAKTVERYKNTPGITGWEIFNEPDTVTVASDAALGLTDPDNYFDLLNQASNVVRRIDPERFVVIAATRSIQQNFPTALDYNKRLRDLGAEALVDIWNVHYYGKQFESVISDGGVGTFLNSLGLPIWVTETGEQGPNNQLAYVETVWPFLKDEVPAIDRFYYYEYGSDQPLENNYGLRTTNSEFPVSDLYVYLRDN